MGFRKAWMAGVVLALAGFLLLKGTDAASVARDRIQRLRNLRKAFYQNLSGAALAEDQFRQALELAPLG